VKGVFPRVALHIVVEDAPCPGFKFIVSMLTVRVALTCRNIPGGASG
jgi:hypothetical protein